MTDGAATSRRARGGSIRARMLFGSGVIAALALLAAGLLLYGATETASRIDEATQAERRIELYGTVSARISDYAIVAIEAMGAQSVPEAARLARLSSRGKLVEEAFDRLSDALAVHVSRSSSEKEANRRATRSLGLARMKAQFEALDRTLDNPEVWKDGATELRTRLDGFATQFSPLLDFAIGEERRARNAALTEIAELRERVVWIAGVVALLSLAVLLLFNVALVGPMLARIGETSRAARMIGAGRLNTRLAVDRRDELGLLFANVNRMAARLDRNRLAVDADRARLNETVAERTLALRTANAELERIDVNRRRFFSDVSHELRTPLTVILSEAEIAKRTTDLDVPRFHSALDVIHARARRLNRRVDDLLRIARSESGHIELASAAFDPSASASAAIEDVRGLAGRSGVVLEAALSPDLLALGDADWTRQVLCGVLENAIRHSPRDGIIRISVILRGDDIALCVTDEGGGVAAGDLERIFERFERGENARRQTGFGVGLALARWAMRGQSGDIVLTSPAPARPGTRSKGPGTEVTLTLPALIEDE